MTLPESNGIIPRVIVRLYCQGNLVRFVCDACAAREDLDRNAAPMVPCVGCSRCIGRNLARRLAPGWRLLGDDPFEQRRLKLEGEPGAVRLYVD